MTQITIRNIDPELKRLIRDLAKDSGRTLSAEATALIRRGISDDHRVGMGTRLFNLIDDRDRGDDLVFEVHGPIGPPPDFD